MKFIIVSMKLWFAWAQSSIDPRVNFLLHRMVFSEFCSSQLCITFHINHIKILLLPFLSFFFLLISAAEFAVLFLEWFVPIHICYTFFNSSNSSYSAVPTTSPDFYHILFTPITFSKFLSCFFFIYRTF